MIRELVLAEFGKFRDRSFPFKAVTVFAGCNEAGKTTLFDALFQELCSPKANRIYGKTLRDRYGEARQAKILFAGKPLRLDEDEFLNLLAIRGGDIQLDLASSGSWMEKVKASLFTGGLDPRTLASRFKTLSSENRTLKHNKALAELEARAETLAGEIARLREKRARILSQEGEALRAQSELETLADHLRTLQAKLKGLDGELELEKNIAERRALNGLLARLEEMDSRSRELDGLRDYLQSELTHYDGLQSEMSALERELELGSSRQRELELRLERGREALAAAEDARLKREALAAAAASGLDRLEAFRSAAGLREAGRWRPGLLASAAACFGLGLAGLGIALATEERPFFLPGALLMAGALLLLFLARRAAAGAEPAGEEFMRRLKDEWQDREISLSATSLEGLTRELLILRQGAERAESEIASARRERLGLQAELETLRAGNEQSGHKLNAQKAALEEWLSRRGVRSRDEYLERTLRAQTLQRELARWQEELRRLLADKRSPDPAQLRRDSERRLSDLDREGVPALGRNGAELKGLERTRAEKAGELEAARERLAGLQRSHERTQGEIQGSLGEIPQELVGREGELREVENRIEALRGDREAAALLQELFARIAQDSEANLLALGRELSLQFQQIVAQARPVEIQALATDSLTLADEAGCARPLPLLSTGTRNAFLLAARAALARKAYPQGGLLVLDEPFLALDTGRTAGALRMLKGLRAEGSWQLVLFTKDETLLPLVREIFPEAQIHLLA